MNNRRRANYDSIADDLLASEELPDGAGSDEIVTAVRNPNTHVSYGHYSRNLKHVLLDAKAFAISDPKPLFSREEEEDTAATVTRISRSAR